MDLKGSGWLLRIRETEEGSLELYNNRDQEARKTRHPESKHHKSVFSDHSGFLLRNAYPGKLTMNSYLVEPSRYSLLKTVGPN